MEEIASQIGPGCNYLQRMYWEKLAEANYDYGKLCPIMYQPYEQIVPGGIAVIGYNPGWQSPGMDKAMEKSFQTKGNWKKEMHEVHKASGGKYIFAPYKKSQQSFDNKGLTTPPGVEGGGFLATQKDEKGNYDQEAPRVRTGPDFSLSNYTIAWQSEKTQPEFLRNTTGGYMYHAQLVKMVTDGGMGAYVRDICGTNLIPFPSQDDSLLPKPKGKLEQLCYDHYLKNFLKVMKPRVVICPTNVYDKLEKIAGVKTKDTKWQQKWIDKNDHTKGTTPVLHYKSGKPQKYLRWGVTSQGTKVLGILHWSGHQSGGTNKLNWQLMTKPDPDSGKTDAQKLFSILLAKGN